MTDRWIRTGKTVGQGGQAQVFVVHDRSGTVSGECALKQLLDDRRRGRLDLEIETTRRLHAKGAKVLPIHDDYLRSEPDSQRPWFVSPLADGGSMFGALVEAQPYRGDEIKALEAFREIAAAVATVHADHVAHRDLKPSNILIHRGAHILCDLGLCLSLTDDARGDRLTGELERIGSLNYIPKEAFGRQAIDRTQSSEFMAPSAIILTGQAASQVDEGWRADGGQEDHRRPRHGLDVREREGPRRGRCSAAPHAPAAQLQAAIADCRMQRPHYNQLENLSPDLLISCSLLTSEDSVTPDDGD